MGGKARWHGILRTVQHAAQARRYLWFFCMNCGHATRNDPRDVLRTLRHDLAFEALAKRLACDRCKTRRARVLADDLEMTSWPQR